MESSANIDGLARAGAGVRAAGGLLGVFSSSRVLLAFVLLAAIYALTAGPVIDPDFWWHLRTGQFIFESRTIPRADFFSHTAAGKEWVAHEWLTEVLMYAVYRAGGWAGLIASFSCVMTAAVWLAYRRAAEVAPHPFVAGAAVLLAAAATAPMWGVRPQMISFLLTSFFVAALARFTREGHARSLWSLPPLMLVWANMHGGFALGLALVGLTAAGVALDELIAANPPRSGTTPRLGAGALLREAWPRVRPLCLALAACAAVVPLNPNGARLFTYPLETITSDAMQRHIHEWMSPDFHRPESVPFALLLLATFAALALSPKRARASELLLVGVSAYAGLRSWRNIPFFALVAAPVLAEHAWLYVIGRSWGRRLVASGAGGVASASQCVLNAALFVAIPLALCVVCVTRAAVRQPAVEAERYPAAAVEFLRAHSEAGPVFNAYGWGGYLIWKLHPERRVYIDGRADVYGDQFVEDYLKAEGGEPGWREPLERHGVRTVMIAPDAALASLLREDESWEKVFEDRRSVVFFKR